MAASTRPLSLGEILDRTIQIYRRNFLLFTGISILPSALEIIVSGAFSIYSSSLLPGLQKTGPGEFHGLLLFFLAFAIFGFIGLPLLVAVYAVTQSALNYATLLLNTGQAVTVRSSYGFGFRFFWRGVYILFLQMLFAGIIPTAAFSVILLILGILAAVLAVAGGKALVVLAVLLYVGLIIALMVVAIWIWMRVSLAFPASAAEGSTAWQSIKRSDQLSKGTRGRIFVMYLLIAILGMIVNYALIIPLDLALGLNVRKLFDVARAGGAVPMLIQITNLTIGFLVRAFVLPLPAIALFLFYTDQRVRLEGYDIEQLMTQAGWPQLPPNTPDVAGAPVQEVPQAPVQGSPRAPFAPAAGPPAIVSPETRLRILDPTESNSAETPVAETGIDPAPPQSGSGVAGA